MRWRGLEQQGGGEIKKGDVTPRGFKWQGTVPPQKWMNFYTKVLSPHVSTPGLKLEVSFEVPPGEAPNDAKAEATRAALRELGLSESLETK